jgi:hypothetical protein
LANRLSIRRSTSGSSMSSQMEDNCPACKANLIGEPIANSPGINCRREIAVYDLDLDRTVARRCTGLRARMELCRLAELLRF